MTHVYTRGDRGGLRGRRGAERRWTKLGMAGPHFGVDRVPRTLVWSALSWELPPRAGRVLCLNSPVGERPLQTGTNAAGQRPAAPAGLPPSCWGPQDCARRKAKGRVWKTQRGGQTFIQATGIRSRSEERNNMGWGLREAEAYYTSESCPRGKRKSPQSVTAGMWGED